MFSFHTLVTNWHFMRWSRLVLGVFIAIQAVIHQDIFAGLVALLFLFQVVTNTGCCGAGGCTIPQKPVSGQLNTREDPTVTSGKTL